MKKLLGMTGLLLCVVALTAQAADTAYDDCILKHLKGARLDVAAHLIKQACDENYRERGLLSDQKKAYNQCLLDHLVGIESLQAAMDIKAACQRKYNP